MKRATFPAPAGRARLPVNLMSLALLCASTAACGPDALTAATTSAKVAADEAKQAKEQKEQIESQLKTIQETEKKRLESMSEQDDRASR